MPITDEKIEDLLEELAEVEEEEEEEDEEDEEEDEEVVEEEDDKDDEEDDDEDDEDDEEESKDESTDVDGEPLEEDVEDAYIESVIEELPESKLGMVQSMYELLSDLTEEEIKDRSRFIIESLTMDTSRLRNRKLDHDLIDSTLEEDVNLILGESDDLDAETQKRVQTIFESAVLRRVDKTKTIIESNYREDLENKITEYKEELAEAVDKLLNDVVSDWATDNELAIVSGVRSEIAENFINQMKNVFKENYIEVPDEKENLIESLQNKVDELEELSGRETDTKSELMQENDELRAKLILMEQSEGLTENEKENLQGLVEHLKFSDAETYEDQVQTIKESVLSRYEEPETEDAELLDEETYYGVTNIDDSDVDESEGTIHNPNVQAVVNNLNGLLSIK